MTNAKIHTNSVISHVSVQDSLGGNSKVLMFVNVSPAVYNLGETLCSLNFATRCRNVELGQAKRQIAAGSVSTPSPSLEDSAAGAGSGVAAASTTITTAGIAAGSGKEPVSPKPMTTPVVKRTSTTSMSTLRK
jgi:kinesin family protein C2/C3